MKNFFKNVCLLVVILVLSYFTASYFGRVYDKFSPLHDGSWIGLSNEALAFIVGLPFAYTFFTILFFQLFGFGNKKKWTLWLLLPPFIFFGSGDLIHIYLPIIIGLIAFAIAKLVHFIISKLKHLNSPIVVK